MVSAYAADITHSWSDEGRSIRLDVISFALAIAVHVPLYFIKVDASKKAIDSPTERLVSVDLLEQMQPKEEAPPAEATPEPVKNNLMDRLKMLVKREPPPPAPAPPKPVVEAPKPVEPPKPIALQANLNTPPPVAPKLESKTGFKTDLDPKVVKEQQLALNAPPVGAAPLSAQKLGTTEDRAAVKQDKGKFQVAANDKLSSIDDKGPALAGAAPTLAIRTGAASSIEKFSAPVAQKQDKGRIGAVPEVNAPKLGFRDSIIARDAAPTQIGGGAAPAAAIPTGTGKKDAGRYQVAALPPALVNNTAPKTAIGTVAPIAPSAPAPVQQAVPKERKKMFQITGPLADRQILKQQAPEYPAWAQAQGIEAAVVLEFTVDAAGDVKPTIVVRRTSGYQKLDDAAIDALRQWKFVALSDVNRDEVGLITFNFSLH